MTHTCYGMITGGEAGSDKRDQDPWLGDRGREAKTRGRLILRSPWYCASCYHYHHHSVTCLVMICQEERRKKEEERRLRDEEKRRRLKVEEREKWWLGAEAMYGTREEREKARSGKSTGGDTPQKNNSKVLVLCIFRCHCRQS